MTMGFRYCIFLAVFYMVKADIVPPRSATVYLSTQNNPGISQTIAGSVIFTESENGLRIVGTVAGLPEGRYKYQIHQLGNIGTCLAAGEQFEPASHLGNAEYVAAVSGLVALDITDTVLTLRGDNNVLGRSLVLHAEENNTTELLGVRVACGVIGIVSPVGPWNSAVTSSPSLLLFIAATIFGYCRY